MEWRRIRLHHYWMKVLYLHGLVKAGVRVRDVAASREAQWALGIVVHRQPAAWLTGDSAACHCMCLRGKHRVVPNAPESRVRIRAHLEQRCVHREQRHSRAYQMSFPCGELRNGVMPKENSDHLIEENLFQTGNRLQERWRVRDMQVQMVAE